MSYQALYVDNINNFVEHMCLHLIQPEHNI